VSSLNEKVMKNMKLHDSASERNVSPDEALAYYDTDSKGLICSICGKKQYEQQGLMQGPEVQICQSYVYIFYNIFI
jgi:hypothetical protein